MHQCIVIPELAEIILSYLNDRSKESKQALFNLSMTCKALSDAVLDLLWNEQSSLVPLFKVMPSATWESKQDMVPVGDNYWISVTMVKFTRVFIPERHWTRFDYYSPKIRLLDLTIADRYKEYFHSSTLICLKSRKPKRSMFPNLEELRLAPGELRHLDHSAIVGFLPSHKLRTLDIELYPHGADPTAHRVCAAAVSKLAKHQLRLTTLRIRQARSYGAASSYKLSTNDIDDLLINQKGLQHLSCPIDSVSNEAIGRLRNLPSLTSLDLYNISRGSQWSFLQRLDSNFPQLQDLSIHFDSICDSAPDTIKCLPQAHVTSLTIKDNDEYALNHLLARLAEAVAASPLASTLTHLRFESIHSGYWGTNTIRRSPAFLGPLFLMKNVRNLDIRASGIGHQLDDDWLAENSKQWGHLHHLTISGGGQLAVSRPRITLKGLLPLTYNCPHLQDLCVDAVWSPFKIQDLFSEGSSGSASQVTDMRYLYPELEDKSSGQACIAKDIKGLASCLKALFPRLRTMYPGGDTRHTPPIFLLVARYINFEGN